MFFIIIQRNTFFIFYIFRFDFLCVFCVTIKIKKYTTKFTKKTQSSTKNYEWYHYDSQGTGDVNDDISINKKNTALDTSYEAPRTVLVFYKVRVD